MNSSVEVIRPYSRAPWLRNNFGLFELLGVMWFNDFRLAIRVLPGKSAWGGGGGGGGGGGAHIK